MEPLPYIINSLKHSEVGEDGQNPENGFHPLEESSYGEKDNALCPFHEPHGTRDLQSLCLGSDVRDKHRTHTDKRGKEDETGISFS